MNSVVSYLDDTFENVTIFCYVFIRYNFMRSLKGSMKAVSFLGNAPIAQKRKMT